MHFVTKTYGHNLGLSACFRQWRAESHCRFLHGYPLSFRFTFAASVLDKNGWVINFGGLKPLKAWLEEMFDHKMLVAQDDPNIDDLVLLGEMGLAQPIVVDAVGLESFAVMAWARAEQLLDELCLSDRVSLVEVEVREHDANGVIYTGAE